MPFLLGHALVDLLGRPTGVVLLPLARVGEDRVGLAKELEPLLRSLPLLEGHFVRVLLERRLAVGLLDVGVARVLADPEHLVVVDPQRLLQLQLRLADQLVQPVGVGVELPDPLVVVDGLLELLELHQRGRPPQVRLGVAFVPPHRGLRVLERLLRPVQPERSCGAVAEDLNGEDRLKLRVGVEGPRVLRVRLFPLSPPERLVARLLAGLLHPEALEALLDRRAAVGVPPERLLVDPQRHVHVPAQVQRSRPQLKDLRGVAVAVAGEASGLRHRLRDAAARYERLHEEHLRRLHLWRRHPLGELRVVDRLAVVARLQRGLPGVDVRADLLRLAQLVPESRVAGVGPKRLLVLGHGLVHLPHADKGLGRPRNPPRVRGV
mmetsp:Transcript_41886/g.99362  ORF Transcript_41886/g.99362 Transcript_41886/m.99362 type:complete len:378 (+) Transcript_41886:1173-2306(+)